MGKSSRETRLPKPSHLQLHTAIGDLIRWALPPEGWRVGTPHQAPQSLGYIPDRQTFKMSGLENQMLTSKGPKVLWEAENFPLKGSHALKRSETRPYEKESSFPNLKTSAGGVEGGGMQMLPLVCETTLPHHWNCRAPVLDATLPSFPGEKRKDPNKIRNERGEVTTDTTEIQRLVRDC